MKKSGKLDLNNSVYMFMYLHEQSQHINHLLHVQPTVDNKSPKHFIKNLLRRRVKRYKMKVLITYRSPMPNPDFANDNIMLLNKLITAKKRKNVLRYDSLTDEEFKVMNF